MRPKLDPVERLLRRRQSKREWRERAKGERKNVNAIVAENRRLLDKQARSDEQLLKQEEALSTATARANLSSTLTIEMRDQMDAHLSDSAALRAQWQQQAITMATAVDDQQAELDKVKAALAAEQRRTTLLSNDNARLQSSVESLRADAACSRQTISDFEKESRKRRHATIDERLSFISRFDEQRRSDDAISDSAIIKKINPSIPTRTALHWLHERASYESHQQSKKMRSTVKAKHLAVEKFVLCRLRELVGTDMVHLPVTLSHIITLAEWGCINCNDTFTPTIAWARKFVVRNGLACRKLTGTRAPNAPDRAAVTSYMRDLFNELASLGFKLNDVWCADEISFKAKLLRQRGFVFEDVPKLPLSKACLDNTAFTALLFFNFNEGTRRPAVIWHGVDKPLLAGITSIRGEEVPPTDLAQNRTAWMRRDIFSAILRAWDEELQHAGSKAALIIDNVSTHHGEGDTNIGEELGLKSLTVRYLLPNTTDVAQLNDTGCNRSVQAAKVRLYSEIVLHEFFSGRKERLTCARGVKMLHAAVAQVDPSMPGRVARHLFGNLLDVLA